MRHAGRDADQRWGCLTGNTTAIYADFRGNGTKVIFSGAGSGKGTAKRQKIPLDKVPAKGRFLDNEAIVGSWNLLPRNWLWVDYLGW
jgi:hypothetical protein